MNTQKLTGKDLKAFDDQAAFDVSIDEIQELQLRVNLPRGAYAFSLEAAVKNVAFGEEEVMCLVIEGTVLSVLELDNPDEMSEDLIGQKMTANFAKGQIPGFLMNFKNVLEELQLYGKGLKPSQVAEQLNGKNVAAVVAWTRAIDKDTKEPKLDDDGKQRYYSNFKDVTLLK